MLVIRNCTLLFFNWDFSSPNLTPLYLFIHVMKLQYFFFIYLDDLLLTGSDCASISKVIKHLSIHFSLKDFGSFHYFLGVEVISIQHGLFLSQQKYIHDLLTCTKMDGAKTIKTLLTTKDFLQLNDVSSSADPIEYRWVIGALQYLFLTRPNISFLVNKLAQSMHKPTKLHWIIVKRVLRHLKGTLNHGILLKRTVDLTL